MSNAFGIGARISYVSIPETRSPVTFAVGLVIVPFLTAFFYLLLASGGTARLDSGAAFAASLASGAITATVTVSTLVVTDRFEGTRPFLLMSPRMNGSLWLGRLSVPVIIGAVTGTASSYAVLLLAGTAMTPRTMLLVPVFVLISVIASAGIGLFIGGLSLTMRDPLIASNIAGYVLPLACGVIAPMTLLPAPVQVVFGLLPLSHLTTAARALMSAESAPSAASELILGFAAGAAWAIIGVIVWKLQERRAVRDGASEQVI